MLKTRTPPTAQAGAHPRHGKPTLRPGARGRERSSELDSFVKFFSLGVGRHKQAHTHTIGPTGSKRGSRRCARALMGRVFSAKKTLSARRGCERACTVDAGDGTQHPVNRVNCPVFCSVNCWFFLRVNCRELFFLKKKLLGFFY